MSAIAFGIPMQFDRAYTEGISTLTADDIRYAEELGYRIKLLGITRRVEARDGDDETVAGIELRVHPTLVPHRRLIANVEGVMNAILVKGDAVGATMYYGAGAGAEPTASAVVADLVDVTRLHTADPEHRVPHLAFQPDCVVRDADPADRRGRAPRTTCGCASPTSPACSPTSRASSPTRASRSARCCRRSRPKARTRPTSSC